MSQGRIVSVTQNTIWNFLSYILPALAAFISIPFLLRHIGTERFGLLTLTWLFFGYFNIFDFGLGRAITKLVAEKGAQQKPEAINQIFWTSLSMLFFLGLVGSTVLFIFQKMILQKLLNVPFDLITEAQPSLTLMAYSFPIMMLLTGTKSMLEGTQSFRALSYIQIPSGVLSYVAPALVSLISQNLFLIILCLLVTRLLALVAYFFICLKNTSIGKMPEFSWMIGKELLQFGGWVTVSNVTYPVLAYADRFFVSSLIGVAAVAYYSTPFEIVTRLWIVPRTIIGVLFPAFSSSHVDNKSRTAELFQKGYKYTFLAVFPASFVLSLFAQDILRLWLSEEFSVQSHLVLQLLCIGVFLNSLDWTPFSLIQGIGRPDVTTKLHLFEVPIYLGLLWWGVKGYGIVGAAYAWLGWNIIETLIIWLILKNLNREVSRELSQLMPYTFLLSLLLVVSLFPESLAAKLVYGLFVMGLYCFVATKRILTPVEKEKFWAMSFGRLRNA